MTNTSTITPELDITDLELDTEAAANPLSIGGILTDLAGLRLFEKVDGKLSLLGGGRHVNRRIATYAGQAFPLLQLGANGHLPSAPTLLDREGNRWLFKYVTGGSYVEGNVLRPNGKNEWVQLDIGRLRDLFESVRL